MTQEEKVRAYDEALSVALETYKTQPMYKDWLEKMFPELKESENDRIRKVLINGFNKLDKSAVWYNGITNAQILDWLEKQVEHANFRNKIQIGDKVTKNRDGYLVNLSQLNRVAKPADKVEPKFNERDWVIIDGETLHITNVTEDGYSTEEGGYIPFRCEKDARLWTIQDAKDGDVLATPDYTLIFKESLKKDGGVSYCHYDFGAGNPQFVYIEDRNWYFGKEAIVHPVTKEQRDILFQKMKEAGYEFDFEKKELKKIEQKPAWSEEDDEQLLNAIFFVREYQIPTRDKKLLEAAKKAEEWLESLRPQNAWKPSVFHLECIEDAIAIYEERGINAIGLKEILEQLKVLRL